MKISDITSSSIKKVSNQELLSLHRRVHQLYNLAKSRKEVNEKFVKSLVKIHIIIIREMKRRNLIHKTAFGDTNG
jgi:hypothetical protein